jgi:hypothetical protein
MKLLHPNVLLILNFNMLFMTTLLVISAHTYNHNTIIKII